MRINFRRWGVFNLVGCGGFVAQIATIALLTRIGGWSPFVATAIALELAATVNFVGHNRWTWRDRPERSARGWLVRYGVYQLSKTASLVANLFLTIVFTQAGLPAEIANTVAVVVCAVPNFFISEHLVFVRRPTG